VKVAGTGGTGANMLAVAESGGTVTGASGYHYWQGTQQFGARVTSLVYSSSDNTTTVGLSDGRMLKVRGTGGCGQNMFAVSATDYGFATVPGYSYLLGSQKFATAVNGIYQVAGSTVVSLEEVTVGRDQTFSADDHETNSHILAKWLSLGGASGQLGLPTGNTVDHGNAFIHEDFASGVISWVAATGAQVLLASPVPGMTVQNAADAIGQAIADLCTMLNARKAALSSWDATEQARFQRWFGSTAQAARQAISARIDRELQLLQQDTLENFAMPDKVDSNTYAYVYPGDATHVIHLDPLWVSAHATGTDSRAGTLAHEMSHFNDIGGTKDWVYGTTGCLNLAKTNSAHALNNADSFEYYVEGA
jgi:hypothetical protein